MYRYFASEVFYRALEKIGVRSQVPHALSWDHLQSLLNKSYRVIYDQLTSCAKDKPYSETAEVTDITPADAPGLFVTPVPQFAREYVLYQAVSVNSPRTTLTHSSNRWQAEPGTYYVLGNSIYVYLYPDQRLYIEYVKQPQTITMPAAPVKLENFPYSAIDFMDNEYVYSNISKMFLKPPYTVFATTPRQPSDRYDRYIVVLLYETNKQ